MRALLVVAHGSRRAASNEEVKVLTDQLRRQIVSLPEAHFGFVHCAFLELADPSIPDGLKECANQGAAEVIVLPYFLSAGRHVAQDIPDIVEKVAPTMAGVNIKIAPYLGTATGLPELMLELAK